MTLDQAKKGSVIQIISIPQGSNRSQLIRMGIAEGSRVVCQEKLPFGPVVLRCRRQEIAIGRQLAQCILVK
jgi:Fe2+ transport system protein FeoA